MFNYNNDVKYGDIYHNWERPRQYIDLLKTFKGYHIPDNQYPVDDWNCFKHYHNISSGLEIFTPIDF